ncbi:MAG: tetratricopeptide repeat protein [Edaphobacter sp.]
MIWLLALQLSLPAQQQHYDNAKNALAKMQFSQADQEVDLALRLHPDFVPALILKARLALFAHRPDVAKSCLIRAVTDDPTSESAQFYLGVFHYLQNDFNLAIPPLEKARSLSPADPMPPFYLAMSKEALGDAQSALRAYEEAETLSPGKTPQAAAILVAHSRLLYSLDRFDESIAKDKLAIEADSQSRDAFYEAAKGLAHQGIYQEAATDGERALTLPELGTSDSQIHFLLGNIYLKLKRPDLAAPHLEKFRAAPQSTKR